jgi:EAL domain-containing protein (putative c-di-GMP-specific phosphodiesterase class I)
LSALLPGHSTQRGIFADEIGIEIGIYGDWRLKTAFRPIFSRQGKRFQPVAVEGFMRPFVFGREVDDQMFRRAVPARDRAAVAAMVASLAIRNLVHTGVSGLKLLLSAGFEASVPVGKLRAAARALAMELRRSGIEAGEVLVELSPLAGSVPAAFAAFESLRRRGVATALKESGNGLIFDRLRAFPDLVVIDGGWFRAVARQNATVRLFNALVHNYRLQGASVLVEGIATAAELDVALDSGADWLSGPLLAPAALAGAVFPEDGLQVETLLDQRRVIPLFR